MIPSQSPPRKIFCVACFGMLLFGICMITLGSLSLSIGHHFSMDEVEIGALFSMMPFGVLTGSLIFGPFCDRFGYKTPLLVSCIFLFAGFQGIAFAADRLQLGIFIFICGLGGGIVNGSTNGVVADISESDKGSNLSLLGIFFALGAIGMPFLLAILDKTFTYQSILSSIGTMPLLVALAVFLTRFPAPKVQASVPFRETLRLATSPLLLLMSFFLFLQSGLEAAVSNWSTRYLTDQKDMTHTAALHALSLSVAGMAVARLMIGSFLRGWSDARVLFSSFLVALIAQSILWMSKGHALSYLSLFLTGFGIAAAFPLMLGMIGDVYPQMSATAFSIALVIALSGNMVINYTIGLVAGNLGINHLPEISMLLIVLMAVMAFIVLQKIKP